MAQQSYWRVWIIIILILGIIRVFTYGGNRPAPTPVAPVGKLTPLNGSQLAKTPPTVQNPPPAPIERPGGQLKTPARVATSALSKSDQATPQVPSENLSQAQLGDSQIFGNDKGTASIKAENKSGGNSLADLPPDNSSKSVAPELTKSYFTLGSTKSDVLRVQGTPSEVSEYQWSYGSSTVQFGDGRVTSWTVRYGYPLKVKTD